MRLRDPKPTNNWTATEAAAYLGLKSPPELNPEAMRSLGASKTDWRASVATLASGEKLAGLELGFGVTLSTTRLAICCGACSGPSVEVGNWPWRGKLPIVAKLIGSCAFLENHVVGC